MTQRQWLKRERRPEYSGINARQSLHAMTIPNTGGIHRKIALRLIDRAVGDVINAIKATR